MDRRRERAAGWLLILGTVWTVVAIRIAEVLTPDYNIRAENVSGLGSTFFSTYPCMVERCNDIYQPASFIFVASLVLVGALLLLASYNISRLPGQRPVARMIAVFGAGALVLGFSYLPLYAGGTAANFILALILHIGSSTFLAIAGALIALRADAFTEMPLKYVSRTMGAIVAIAVPVYTYMFVANSLSGPGFGGVERLFLYVILAWFVMYGVYLLKTADKH